MEFFAILTMATPGKQSTAEGVLTLEPDATRASIFQYMRDQLVRQNGPGFAQANVVFFAVESNRLDR